MPRKLFLVCGLSATGKSRWCNYILGWLRARGEEPQFFDIDLVREATWGERAKQLKSAEEHRFKNQLTRQEVQKAFVLGAQTVVLNMVMPTKQQHQAPFMAMIRETERILTQIEKDYSRLDPASPEQVKITVQALWFDCDETTARRRLTERARGSHESDLTDIAVWLSNKSWFEPPDGESYPFLRIDTSDESREADQVRLEQISNFIA